MRKILCVLTLLSPVTLNAIGCFPAPIPKEPEVQLEDVYVQEELKLEPQIQEPQVQEPQVQEPQVQEPQVQEPQVQEPQVQEPEIKEPEIQEPQVPELQVQELQVQEPQVQESQVQESQVQEPEVKEPQVQEPKVEEPKVEEPQQQKPQIQDPQPEAHHTQESSDTAVKSSQSTQDFSQEALLAGLSDLPPIKHGVVNTGRTPDFITYSHSGKFAVVPSGDSNTLSVYKVKHERGSLTEIASSPFVTGNDPDCVAFSPCDRFLAVTHASPFFDDANALLSSISIYRVHNKSGSLSLLQTITRSDDSTLSLPTSVAYSPDGRFAAVTNYLSSTNGISIYAVSPVTGKFLLPPIQSFQPAGPNPYFVAYSPDGKFAAVTRNGDMHVSNFRVDPVTGFFTDEFSVSTDENPAGVTYSHNGEFAVVANSGTNTLTTYAVDQYSGHFTILQMAVGAGVTSHPNPFYITYSQNDKVAAVANHGEGTSTLYCVTPTGAFLNPATFNINGGLLENAAPVGIEFAPASDFLAVTDVYYNNVSVFYIDEAACP